MAKKNYNAIIGKNVAAFRTRSGFTQEQVIARMQLLDCEICRSSYSKIETGKRRLDYYEMVALSYIFRTNTGEFFSGIHLKNPHLVKPDTAAYRK